MCSRRQKLHRSAHEQICTGILHGGTQRQNQKARLGAKSGNHRERGLQGEGYAPHHKKVKFLSLKMACFGEFRAVFFWKKFEVICVSVPTASSGGLVGPCSPRDNLRTCEAKLRCHVVNWRYRGLYNVKDLCTCCYILVVYRLVLHGGVQGSHLVPYRQMINFIHSL